MRLNKLLCLGAILVAVGTSPAFAEHSMSLSIDGDNIHLGMSSSNHSKHAHAHPMGPQHHFDKQGPKHFKGHGPYAHNGFRGERHPHKPNDGPTLW